MRVVQDFLALIRRVLDFLAAFLCRIRRALVFSVLRAPAAFRPSRAASARSFVGHRWSDFSQALTGASDAFVIMRRARELGIGGHIEGVLSVTASV
jgi:hypothetical protein